MPDRCGSCGHPLAEGEWTRCDAECRHAEDPGSRWFVPAPIDGPSIRKAPGRARAEERDCPECGGGGMLVDPVGNGGECPYCEPPGSGRVRPLLCQACEGAET